MRDPNRIPYILLNIQWLWEKYPDLRLGQLLWCANDMKDPFYMEDDVLLERIKKDLKKFEKIDN